LEGTAAVILVGGWIEGLYLATNLVGDSPLENNKLVERIVDQKLSLDIIINLLNESPEDDDAKDKLSGIGLSNVKRRLELLYGPNQELKIIKQQDWFTVSLRLNLNE